MPAILKPPGPSKKSKKKKKIVKRKIRPRKLRLKGSLKTPEDWARFDAWAKINALPRKLPEPEPIVRPSKPLRSLRRRLINLSRPRLHVIAEIQCVIRELSRAALKAKTTPRTKRLARPRFREIKECHEWKIHPAVLRYEASENIIYLSQPRMRTMPECRTEFGTVSQAALKRIITKRDEELARPKKVQQEDEDEEDKKEEISELSPWMEFLALPPYRVLKDQHTENAEKWKEQIFEELGVRGKQAFEEQQRRQAEKKGKEIKEKSQEQNSEEMEEQEKSEEEKKKERMEKEAWRFTDSTCKVLPEKVSKSAMNYTASEKITSLAVPKERKDHMSKENPYMVKKSAKSAGASPRVTELATPKMPRDPVERPPPREKDEWGRPIIPVPVYERVLPKVKPYKMSECKEKTEEEKENDQAVQEQKEPEVEKEEVEEVAEEPKKKEKVFVSKLALAPTIDPLFDPVGAAKQANDRKRMREEAEKNDEENG